MRKILTTTLIFFVCATNYSFAQDFIQGRIMDSLNNEPLIGAHVVFPQGNTVTGQDGRFTFSSSEFPVKVTVSYLGYKSKTLYLKPTDNSVLILLQMISTLTDEVVVRSTRVDKNDPFTSHTISTEKLEKQNFGQDLPFMMELTPSLVTTSDAGAGIGYTGMRIRGSDMTRINVTINGIPVNDSESHGVYWVNMPDLGSSTESIQIQRGVGASTNGAASFGASVNMHTGNTQYQPYSSILTGMGSYGTFRNTLRVGTGLMENGFSFDARLSLINSEGYIDRSSSDLRSFYLSGGYNGKKTIIKAIVFSGKERTYQAWWGTPEARLKNDVEGMNFVADMNWYSDEQRDNLLNSGRTFNYYLYENEVDNYQQDHYQLHFSNQLKESLLFNAALHYTYGRGYYEQYRPMENFSDYGLSQIDLGNGVILDNSDMIRRRWLDNNFYGITYSLISEKENQTFTLGGASNKYIGDHFGEIIWAQFFPDKKGYKYYDNRAWKSDHNAYFKYQRQVSSQLNLFTDLQYRNINYTAEGSDNDYIAGVPKQIDVQAVYHFFNPKLGLFYQLSNTAGTYISYSVAHREPVRSDFIDASAGEIPEPEVLKNMEAGLNYQKQSFQGGVNFYLMKYNNQLVLTGELNDVGSPIRKNVDKSYRMGIEFSGVYSLSEKLNIEGNITLSKNKINEFTDVIYDYGVNWDEYNLLTTTFTNTDISFSPGMISGSVISYKPVEPIEIRFMTKYVGQQYLDNTQSKSRSIDAYLINNIAVETGWDMFGVRFKTSVLVNNIFNALYESNGYTFGYKGGGIEIRENYYYPQAPTNLLINLKVDF